MKKIFGLVFVLALAFGTTACSANLCQRQVKAMGKCQGTDVTFTPDSMCEHNLDVCGPAKLGAFEQYVRCLEGMRACSLDAIGQCAQAYPGGVNLMCAG